MEINLSAHHPGATDHVKEYAEGKVGRLDRYFEGIQMARLFMGRDGTDSVVELVISATGRQIACEAKENDLYAAVDRVMDKAEIQLTKHKEKLKEHRPKSHGGSGEQEELG